MPVIQGRSPTDYERCIDALWQAMTPGTIVGVGSMCRREIAGPEGLVAVFEHLDRVLPAGVRLHGFGIKGSALPYLTPLANRIASIDSQAYGIAARRDALRRGVAKTDILVADHLERWLAVQHARLREPAKRQSLQPKAWRRPPDRSAWEAATADAREELRKLIEAGELDHDEVMEGWIQQWAADSLAHDQVFA